MKNAASKKTGKAMLTASWDGIWTSYTAAVRSGDAERISSAKTAVQAWHSQAGATCPSWAF